MRVAPARQLEHDIGVAKIEVLVRIQPGPLGDVGDVIGGIILAAGCPSRDDLAQRIQTAAAVFL